MTRPTRLVLAVACLCAVIVSAHLEGGAKAPPNTRPAEAGHEGGGVNYAQ
jgi:hypothetical protein